MSIDLNSRIVQGLARRRFLQRSLAVGGAALTIPPSVSVVTSAIGRGTTRLVSSL